MNKVISRAVVIVLVSLGNAWAADSEQGLVFDPASASQLPADFEQTPAGSWKIADGKLEGTGRAPISEATLLLGKADFADVEVEATVSFASAANDSRWFGIFVRETPEPGSGLQFTVRYDTTRGNGAEIASKGQAGAWRVLRAGRPESGFRQGKSHRVRVEAVGDWICGYLDGKMVLRSWRGNEFARSGRVGLRVSGATVLIEQVKVTPLDADKISVPEPVRTRPLVIAHRGFSSVAPENTLVAYRMAIEAGADMAECDVYLTKDGVPVLMHDRTLERTTGVKKRMRELTLEEVRQLEAGKWKDPKFAGEPVPTLVQAIELTKGKLRLVIEIKEEEIAPQVLENIRKTDVAPEDLMIFSFYHRVVDEMGRLEPRLPTTWLLDEPGLDEAAWRETLAKALEARVSAVGTSVNRVDPGFVRLAHECGLPVFVWTVNEPSDVDFLVRTGVDGIISDRPDMVFDVLGARD